MWSFACPRWSCWGGPNGAVSGWVGARLADIGKGKVCDVVCDAIQLIRGHLQVGPDSLQQRVGQDEDQDLPHDAEGAKPGLVVVGRQADHSTNQFQQALKERAANLADEAAQRWGGLGEFRSEEHTSELQ